MTWAIPTSVATAARSRRPHLDRLAANGLRFTQFYNTSRCWASRASILTGYYPQAIRRDMLPEEDRGEYGMFGATSGANGVRPRWAQMLPAYLKQAGYRSYHSGKWHMDGDRLPAGFDRSYSLEDHNRFFSPENHFEDDVKLPPVKPDSGYYSTTYIADHAIKCLKEHAENMRPPVLRIPRLHRAAFPSACLAGGYRHLSGSLSRRLGEDPQRTLRPHAQDGHREGRSSADPKRWCSPAGISRKRSRSRRSARMRWPSPWRGIRSPGATPVPSHENGDPCRDDPPHGHRDRPRAFAQIESMGALDNTIVIFLADNGASPEQILRGDGHDPFRRTGHGAFLPRPRCRLVHRREHPVPAAQVMGPRGRHLHAAGRPLARRHQGSQRPAPSARACRGSGSHPDGTRRREGSRNPSTASRCRPCMARAWCRSSGCRAKPPHESLWFFHDGHRAIRAGDWKLVAKYINRRPNSIRSRRRTAAKPAISPPITRTK
jgi:arylsulfatase A-like enzyme